MHPWNTPVAEFGTTHFRNNTQFIILLSEQQPYFVYLKSQEHRIEHFYGLLSHSVTHIYDICFHQLIKTQLVS